MNVKTFRTSVFGEGEDLVLFIQKYIKKPKEGSVIVITSKIVALSEGRTADLRQKVQMIKSESQFALKTKYAWLTIKEGTVMANAGVDESNAKSGLVLLPKDSFASAALIRNALRKKWGLRKLGVLVTDSRLMPLRAGVVGVALGYAGFKGVRDYRGTKDIFGRVLKMSRTDVADSLATAAVLEMGEGSERMPLAMIEGARIEFSDRVDRHELVIDIKDDLYYPLFQKSKRSK